MESAWNQEALFDMFLHAVSEEVKDELAAPELPTELDSLIALTIRIDGPMPLGRAVLSPAERQ